jgi:GrpB-like predicted nucleotidyltransferase (UPF0157 family)
MLLQNYQESWANDFKEIKKVLEEALFKRGVSIIHIGSTSIPGLAAKPVIDIDIVYGPGVDFNEVKDGLERVGYYHNGDQGIKGREVFKRGPLAIKHKLLDTIRHHLYVCPAHSVEWDRHLLFRNFLVENERERQQYQEIKRQIAEKAKQDGKKYAQLKEVEAREFIQSIIERAKRER